MKILLAMPRVRTVRGIIGEYCKEALEALGHEVRVFDFSGEPPRPVQAIKSAIRRMLPQAPSLRGLPFVDRAIDQRVNKLLLEAVERFRPDILLVLLGENILPETISAIRNKGGIQAVNWSFDPISTQYRREFLGPMVGVYDYVFFVDSLAVFKEVQFPSGNVFSLPLAAAPNKFRRCKLSASELKKYGSDIAFVGTMTPYRQEVLKELRDFNLKIWGLWQKKDSALLPFYAEQDVYGEKAMKIYNAAKIIIDLRQGFEREGGVYHVSPRIYEVPACGGFLLAPSSHQIIELFKLGEEMICYGAIDELKRLIRYYLDHPDERQAIAQKAEARVHAAHTYEIRLKQLIGIVSG